MLSEAFVLVGAGSSGGKSNLGGAASQSWGELASRASNALKGNTDSRQHTPSLGSSHTSHQSSSGIVSSNTGSSSNGNSLDHSAGQHSQGRSQGVSAVQASGLGALGVGTGVGAHEEEFLSQRDPTNPSSVVGAHSAWIAEPHTSFSQGKPWASVMSDASVQRCNAQNTQKLL